MKPLEEAYRSRNQTCQLTIEVEHRTLTPEVLKEALRLRISQMKRFLVESRNAGGADELMILLARYRLMTSPHFPKN